MDVRRRNNVVVAGRPDGPPIVFAHGLGTDQSIWRLVVPEFVADHRVVLFDHVGAGGSDPAAFDPVRYTSLWAYADDVLELLDVLDLHDVVFVGHSASAMIGVLAAVQQPQRFSRLVLLGPSPRYVNDEDYVGGFSRADVETMLAEIEADWPSWVRKMAPVLVGDSGRPAAPFELADIMTRSDQRAVSQFARTTFLSDTRDVLPRLETRALILQTRDDVVVPGAIAEYLHDHLSGSELIYLEASGHLPNLSAPRVTASAIKAFL